MNYTRALAVAALATAVVAANAATFVFDFSSAGSFTTSPDYSVTDTNILDDWSSATVTKVQYGYTNPGLSGPTSGSGTIWVAGGTIDFTFAGSVTSLSAGSNALNGAVITFGNGTGILAGKSGTGSISNTLDWANQGFGDSRTTFYGEVVPEPASMAALAVGALALARKRRK